MKRVALWVAAVLITLQVASLAAQHLDYANQLYRQGKYPAAILEYERYLYFQASNDSDSLTAMRSILRSYYRAGLYDSMTQYMEQNSSLAEDSEFSTRIVGLAQRKMGHYELARLIPQSNNGSNALLLRGIAELYLDRTNNARLSFATIDTLQWHSYPGSKEELLSICQASDQLPRRSAWLAGSLAFVPGAGYAYNGKWQTAVASLLLHAAFFASAYELRQNDLPISSALVAMAGTAYYIGSIYGSVNEAQKYNRAVREKYLDANLAPWIQYLENE